MKNIIKLLEIYFQLRSEFISLKSKLEIYIDDRKTENKIRYHEYLKK